MTRNSARINNHYQRSAAWDDWAFIAARAVKAGHELLALNCWPVASAGVTQIDTAIGMVRAQLAWPEVHVLRDYDREQR